MKETLKQAGYKMIGKRGLLRWDGTYLLQDKDGKYEVWAKNKNHASYGLIYKNTHLEFCHSLKIR
ncbi:MAG: hypothetical protein JETCAE03_35100 [Ignavibacteriaceae bacterium]|jgi:hypothetical protein|nr:MAG: hypothetical protein JETCAE03_35100 [Ignavibacteriaceae bacterium]